MLTSDLIRAKVSGSSISPSLINLDKPSFQEHAERLLEYWQQALSDGATRGQLEAYVDEWIGDRRDVKVLRGIAKVLLDRSEFETQSPISPPELREMVFKEARRVGPLALEADFFGRPTADDVHASVAAKLGVSPEVVKQALYADLREHERLIKCTVPDASWLLNRYNVALVQALLLRSTEIVLTLEDASVPRIRQLFRYLKFHQLMHRSERRDKQLRITIDGPSALFRQSDRYGRELAVFFPAVLLQQCAWRLTATVLWTKARHEKHLEITSADPLVSHYRDQGAYRTREQAAFEERWAAKPRTWELTTATTPITLGTQGFIVPDYTFTGPEGQVAHLELIGFWRRETLQTKLDAIARYGPGNVVVAVSGRRSGSKGKTLPSFDGEMLSFAEVLPPNKVLKALEAVAHPSR